MADVAASGTPWFLSGQHCIDSQTVASTVVTYWFYRSAFCDSGTLDPSSMRLLGGATLLYASTATDTAFMRLERTPPAGVRYAGSLLSAPLAGTPVTALHHPAGDLLKLSAGEITGTTGCAWLSEGGLSCEEPGDDFTRVRWSRGTTQGGSSGSALFQSVDGRNYLSANLYAGSASCQASTSPDYFGRFDRPYRDALYRWLGEVPGAR
nr:trypsin-like peptidase domain-containing protein [Ramlibacter aurantiacus]